jgi:hypothetical protein
VQTERAKEGERDGTGGRCGHKVNDAGGGGGGGGGLLEQRRRRMRIGEGESVVAQQDWVRDAS